MRPLGRAGSTIAPHSLCTAPLGSLSRPVQAAGIIRSSGAAMTQPAMLADFIRNTDLDVVMANGCYTLLEQTALHDLLPTAIERNVSVIAAGVFGSGVLTSQQARATSPSRYGRTTAEIGARANAIAEIWEDHGVMLPVAAVHFVLGHPRSRPFVSVPARARRSSTMRRCSSGRSRTTSGPSC